VQWGEAVGVGLIDIEALVDDITNTAADGRLMQHGASHARLLSIT
jgi:hypothetical protein